MKSKFASFALPMIALLLATSAKAQVVGVIDNHTIMEGSKSVTTTDLMKTVADDMQSQGVDPMNPLGSVTGASKRVLLTFGTGVTRAFLYIKVMSPTRTVMRWEPRDKMLSFNPENLPLQVIQAMMKAKKLKAMTYPNADEFGAAVISEIQKQGVNPASPENGKKVCLKLGYRHCKVQITFTNDAQGGLIEWSMKGWHFISPQSVDLIIRKLQNGPYFKDAKGQNMPIIQEGDLEEDDNTAADTKDLDSSDAVAKKISKDVPGNSTIANPTGAKNPSDTKSAIPTKIVMVYNLADDQNDFAENSDDNDGVVVKGVNRSAAQGTGKFVGNGNGDGNSDGNGTNKGIGIGFGDSNGVGGVGSIKTSMSTGVQSCNTRQSSGGSGTTKIPMNFGSKPGHVNVSFEAYSIPDEMLISCNGHLLARTQGMVSGLNSLSFEFKPFGTGKDQNVCIIIVNGNENSGTAWDFVAACPGDQFHGNTN